MNRGRATRPPGLGSNYWRLWTATVTANLGDGLALVAYPWLASAVTRDPLQISLVVLLTRLPWLLFSLPAGVITDRVDRRRLVASMDVARFVITLGVAGAVLASQASLSDPAEVAAGTAGTPPNQALLLALLYVAALLLGSAEVLRDNAAQTLLPSIVAKDRLETANGRMWGAEMVTNSFVGPPLAGALIGVAFALPFFVESATFAVAAALVFTLSGQFAPKGQTTSGRISWRAEISEGFGWLWHHPLLRPMAIILGGLNAMSAMAMATYVLFVQDVLGLSAETFGLLLTSAAAGGIVGSVLAPRVSRQLGSGTALFVSLLGMGICLAVVGLTSSAVVVWVTFVIEGFLIVVWNVITVSLRQTIIPDHLLGRVNSVYRFFGWGTIPLGTLLGGLTVLVVESVAGREWGLRWPFLIAAGVHVVFFFYALPKLNTANIERARSEAQAVEPATR